MDDSERAAVVAHERRRVDDEVERIWVAAISAPVHDDDIEGGILIAQSGFVRGAAHADRESQIRRPWRESRSRCSSGTCFPSTIFRSAGE